MRVPPTWSIGFLLALVLLVSATISVAWFQGAGALGLSRALIDKSSFLLVEVLGILLPALGLAWLLRADPKQTFPFARPRLTTALVAILATLGLSIVLTYVQEVYQKFFDLPYPKALLEVLAIQTPFEGLLLIAGVVLGAAVCEEALFRGYVQSALQDRLKPAAAILISAVLFALFHLEPAGLPTYLLLGAWLGWLRYAGGSLWLPILGHATNNLLALIQVNLLGESFWLAHAFTFAPLGVLLAVGGGLGLRRMLAR